MTETAVLPLKRVERVWAMPSLWTFSIPFIKQLLSDEMVGEEWYDPFSGLHSPAKYRNDLEDRPNKTSNMDGLEFLKSIADEVADGVLFDPPYSVEQCLRFYTPKQNGTAGRTEYWARCKDEIARVVKPGGVCISFGWDSTGIGKRRGFEITRVVLMCHGACHNDTIITVDNKVEHISRQVVREVVA